MSEMSLFLAITTKLSLVAAICPLRVRVGQAALRPETSLHSTPSWQDSERANCMELKVAFTLTGLLPPQCPSCGSSWETHSPSMLCSSVKASAAIVKFHWANAWESKWREIDSCPCVSSTSEMKPGRFAFDTRSSLGLSLTASNMTARHQMSF